MVKKTVKQMLVDLCKEGREQMRCTLVHELKKEADDVTKPYREQIDEWESDISALNNQIAEVRNKIRKHANERDERLKEKKLHIFTHQTCGDALHSRLTKFDQITNNHIIEILENTGKKQ